MRDLGSSKLERWSYRLAPVVIPPILFFLVRPDWYYEQNRIDTFFYAGYAQNLGYLLKVSGQMHYFVSRWPLYLPERFFFLLFGAKGGYLVFRWLMAALMFAAVQRFGRTRWSTWAGISLATLVLLMPMYLRTLLTGYTDSVAVTLGLLSIIAVLTKPRARTTPLWVGLSTGLVFALNPLYASMTLLLVVVWLVDLDAWSARLRVAAEVFLYAVAVNLIGFLVFRYHFGVPNIYKPLFDALNEYKNLQDLQKSSQLWWLGYRIWIYIPAILLLAAFGSRRWFAVQFDRAEVLVIRLLALQYLFQIWYQFSRHGDTLEISYYWSSAVPIMIVASVMIVGRLASRTPSGEQSLMLPGIVATVLVFILLFRTHMPRIFGHWIDALIAAAVVGYLWRRFGGRRASFSACSLVFLVFSFQFGAPRPEPFPPGETALYPTHVRVNALYDKVYDPGSSLGIDVYRAETWFKKALHSLGSDVEEAAYFWTGSDGNSDRIATMYQIQITGRWLDPKLYNDPLIEGVPDPYRTGLVASGAVKVVVLIGTIDEVTRFNAAVDGLRPGSRSIFEGTAPNKARTVVRVLQYP